MQKSKMISGKLDVRLRYNSGLSASTEIYETTCGI